MTPSAVLLPLIRTAIRRGRHFRGTGHGGAYTVNGFRWYAGRPLKRGQAMSAYLPAQCKSSMRSIVTIV